MATSTTYFCFVTIILNDLIICSSVTETNNLLICKLFFIFYFTIHLEGTLILQCNAFIFLFHRLPKKDQGAEADTHLDVSGDDHQPDVYYDDDQQPIYQDGRRSPRRWFLPSPQGSTLVYYDLVIRGM